MKKEIPPEIIFVPSEVSQTYSGNWFRDYFTSIGNKPSLAYTRLNVDLQATYIKLMKKNAQIKEIEEKLCLLNVAAHAYMTWAETMLKHFSGVHSLSESPLLYDDADKSFQYWRKKLIKAIEIAYIEGKL